MAVFGAGAHGIEIKQKYRTRPL